MPLLEALCSSSACSIRLLSILFLSDIFNTFYSTSFSGSSSRPIISRLFSISAPLLIINKLSLSRSFKFSTVSLMSFFFSSLRFSPLSIFNYLNCCFMILKYHFSTLMLIYFLLQSDIFCDIVIHERRLSHD